MQPISQSVTRPRFLLSLSFILLIAAYARSLTFGFLIDDNQLLLADLRIRKLACIPALFRGNYFAGTSSAGEFYRPLANSWFAVNYALFGLHPAGWHLTSVLLHVAVTLALYAVCARLLEDRTTAAIAALLFAVMPIHAEPVLWLSCAGDELTAFFLLLTLILIDLSLRRLPVLIPTLITYAACLASKESSTLFPVIFAVVLWERSQALPHRIARILAIFTPLLAVDIAFFVLRTRVLGHVHVQMTSLSEFLITLPRICAFYLFKLISMFAPAEFYNLARAHSTASLAFWGSLVVVVFALALAFFLSRALPITRLPLALIAVPLVPAIAAGLFVADLVHDRYLYLPSAGMAMLFALAFNTWLRRLPESKRHVPIFVLLILVIPMAVDLALESGRWHDDWTLASTSIQLAPNSSEANIYYGNELHARERDDLAAPFFRRALELYPANYWALIQLGDVALRSGNVDDATANYQRAIALSTARGTPEGIPYARLALIHELQHDNAAATASLQQALHLDPQIVTLHLQLAHLFELAGNPEAAQQEHLRAQQLAHTDPCH